MRLSRELLNEICFLADPGLDTVGGPQSLSLEEMLYGVTVNQSRQNSSNKPTTADRLRSEMALLYGSNASEVLMRALSCNSLGPAGLQGVA